MRADNHFALIIGIADYQNLSSLGAAVVRDVRAIDGVLTDPAYCAYPPENVSLLTNKAASYNGCRQVLGQLAQQTNADSIVTIYFSGHGGRLGNDGQHGTYLLLSDSAVSDDQSTVERGISSEEFSDLLGAITARKMLVILDCCHAGEIGHLKSVNTPVLKAAVDTPDYNQLFGGEGRVILGSSLGSETSAILFGDDNSLFTKHLLAGLRGGVKSHDGLIRVFGLFQYLRDQVSAENPQQTPFFQGALQDDFPVALYKGGTKEPYVATANPVEIEDEYEFDVYLSYLLSPMDNDDMIWVEEEFIKELVSHDLRVASLRDSGVAGAARLDVDAIGMTRARRTVVVISEQSIKNHWSNVESMAAQHMGIHEGSYRVLPVYREAIEEKTVPLRLSMLTGIHLESRRREREMERLIKALKSPLPKM